MTEPAGQREPQLPGEEAARAEGGLEPMPAGGAADVEGLALMAVRRLTLPAGEDPEGLRRLVGALAAVVAAGAMAGDDLGGGMIDPSAPVDAAAEAQDKAWHDANDNARRAAEALARLGPTAAEAVPVLLDALSGCIARGSLTVAGPHSFYMSSSARPSFPVALIGALGAAGAASQPTVVPVLSAAIGNDEREREVHEPVLASLIRLGPAGAAAAATHLAVADPAQPPRATELNRADASSLTELERQWLEDEGDVPRGFASYPHDFVSSSAARLLAECPPDHDGVRSLIGAAIGPDKFTRHWAVRAVARLLPSHALAGEAAGALAPYLTPHSMACEHQDYAVALARLGPGAVPAIESVATWRPVGSRVWAAEALAAGGCPEALPALRRLIGDSAIRVRVAAAAGLLRLGFGEDAEPILLEALNGGHEAAAHRAVDAMDDIEPSRVGHFVEQVTRLALSSAGQRWVRIDALDKLLKWGCWSSAAGEALLDAVKRGDSNQKLRGYDDAFRLAERAADRLDQRVRGELPEALAAAILQRDGRPFHDRLHAFRALRRLGGDGAALVARLLGLIDVKTRWGTPDPTDILETLGEIGPAAANALPELKRLSRRHSSPRARIAAAGARIRIGGRTPEPVLMLLWWAAGPDADARREALDELAGLEPPPAESLHVAVRMLGERVLPVAEAACRLLGAMGPPAGSAVPLLVGRLAAPAGDADLRGACAAALARIGPAGGEPDSVGSPPRVVSAFASALSSPLWRLRLAVLESLGGARAGVILATHPTVRERLAAIAASDPVARLRRLAEALIGAQFP